MTKYYPHIKFERIATILSSVNSYVANVNNETKTRMVFPRISLKLTTQRMEMLTYFHGNNTILEWQFVSNNANMGFAW